MKVELLRVSASKAELELRIEERMEEIERIIELGGDQNFFTQYYLEFADIGHDDVVVAIDDHQRIFLLLL